VEPALKESDFDAHSGTHAAQAIVDLANENPDSTMLCLGPLTNLALALKLYPAIGSKLKHLYLMGGNYQAVGNVPTSFTAEYNFYKDPEAAHIVLSELTCPITIVPWEIYLTHSCSTEFVAAYTHHETTTKGRFISAVLRGPMASLEKLQLTYGFCDELPTAVAIDPSIILETENRYYASVELHGLHTRGQVAIDRRNCSGRKPNVQFVTKVDMRKVEKMMLQSLEDKK